MIALEYEEMLKKIYYKLPKEVVGKGRFEIPLAEVVQQGSQTIIKNFAQICTIVRREQKHIFKFLTKELAVPASISDQMIIMQGRFSQKAIQQKLEMYIKEFVFCAECGSPDTKLIKQGRITIMLCEACGARASVKAI